MNAIARMIALSSSASFAALRKIGGPSHIAMHPFASLGGQIGAAHVCHEYSPFTHPPAARFETALPACPFWIGRRATLRPSPMERPQSTLTGHSRSRRWTSLLRDTGQSHELLRGSICWRITFPVWQVRRLIRSDDLRQQGARVADTPLGRAALDLGDDWLGSAGGSCGKRVSRQRWARSIAARNSSKRASWLEAVSAAMIAMQTCLDLCRARNWNLFALETGLMRL